MHDRQAVSSFASGRTVLAEIGMAALTEPIGNTISVTCALFVLLANMRIIDALSQAANSYVDYVNPAFQNESPLSQLDAQARPSTYSTPNVHESFKDNRLAFLDKMLTNYDKRVWPTYGKDEPTVVTVNVYINSMGSINAANMEFGMDIYLRQSWVDPRLELTKYGINTTVTLNGQDIMERIWKPDLFFRNLKSASFHMVTVPNKLIKMSPNGKILFSMRLTLRLSCHMTFQDYPLDKQQCWVVVGSYAQTDDQVKVRWQRNKPIAIEKGLELPEFDMFLQKTGDFTRRMDTGNFSFLNVSFLLVRQNGYHLVQTYLPTFLIVTISWISFWLHVDATPARVTLGVTTLLALTTVSSGVRTQLPPVSYVKAIDIWIGACSVMVFGALLEFTLVNYISRRNIKQTDITIPINIFGKYKKSDDFNDGSNHLKEPKPIQIDRSDTCKELEKKENLRTALTVDRFCRVLFPLAFLIFNVIYWAYYLFFT